MTDGALGPCSGLGLVRGRLIFMVRWDRSLHPLEEQSKGPDFPPPLQPHHQCAGQNPG